MVLWGYKLHLVADATHDLLLFGMVTTAKRNDSPEMLPLLDRAMGRHFWLKPGYVMADKGYDALSNHEGVRGRGGMFICPARRRAGEGKRTLTPEQADREILEDPPTCTGGLAMEYVRSHRYRGLLFRCRPEGCDLKQKRPYTQFACRLPLRCQMKLAEEAMSSLRLHHTTCSVTVSAGLANQSRCSTNRAAFLAPLRPCTPARRRGKCRLLEGCSIQAAKASTD